MFFYKIELTLVKFLLEIHSYLDFHARRAGERFASKNSWVLGCGETRHVASDLVD